MIDSSSEFGQSLAHPINANRRIALHAQTYGETVGEATLVLRMLEAFMGRRSWIQEGQSLNGWAVVKLGTSIPMRSVAVSASLWI